MSKFVVLEGMDGSGKSTQAKLLANKLREAGGSVCLTAEPSAEPIGKLIRERIGAGDLDWRELALLFFADRMEHLRKVVLPELALDHIVICDRYWLSTFVYQTIPLWQRLGAGGMQAYEEFLEARNWLRELGRFALRPDLTIVIDVSLEMAIERLGSRTNRDSFEETETLRSVAEMYGRAELFLGDQIVHVDGGGTPEETQSAVLNAALEVLAL